MNNWTVKTAVGICALGLLAGCAARRTPDTLVLNGGQEIRGRLQSFRDGIFYFQPQGQALQKIPAAAVQELRGPNATGQGTAPAATPAPPPPADPLLRPEYATPQVTLETYHRAAARGDFETMAACCSNDRRPSCLEDLRNLPAKQVLENMERAKATQFTYEPPLIQGNHAFLKFSRREKNKEQVEILSFVLESDGWKIESE